MGSSIQSRVSLARGEGNPDGNLTKPALASSSLSWWFKVCWRWKAGIAVLKFERKPCEEEEDWEKKRENMRLLVLEEVNDAMRDEVEFACVGVDVDVWFANIELWLLFVFANEFLLSLDFCEYDSFVWIEIGLRTFLRRGRVFLSKSFTILTNMFLDLDFLCFCLCFFFGALNCESTEMGYGNLMKLTPYR